MAISHEELEATTMFTVQMLTHFMRNAIHNHAYHPDAARANINETVEHMAQLSPQHRSFLEKRAKEFLGAVDIAESNRPD